MYRKIEKFIQMAVSKYIHLLIAILICCLKDSMGIDAPDYVAVSNEGSTDSLKVTWIPPVDATNQEVTWSPTDGLGSSGNISGTANEYNITGLTPGTLYNVTVTAYNGTDDNISVPEQGRTRPSPVSDLTESGATNESISAIWTKPDGVVDQYLASCSDGTVDPLLSIIDDDRKTTYNASCMGLSTAGADYTITVTSQSGNENSSVSTIPITALPSHVTDLGELGATNDSVSANWTKPPGVVTNYTAICPGGSNQTIPEDYDGSTKEVTCEDLPDPGPGGNHTITVITMSGDKASDPATITITAYPNIVDLREGNITTRQITVEWPDPYGVEDSFIVDCADDGSDDITLNPGDATNGIFQATCDVPMAGAPFGITVISVSGERRSSVTGTFTAAIPEQVAVEETVSNTTSITVSWNASSSADEYEVSCSNGTSVPSSPLLGSATQVTCDGVTPGGNHSVSIVTVENGGKSPATVTYVVAVPKAAVNLTEVGETTNSISANWSMPDGIVEYYEVSCSNGTASPAQVNPSDELIASCVNLLTPGDDYDISVTTVSNNQSSETRTIKITALPDAVMLAEGPSNNTAISATWTVLGVVDSFTIICSNGTASPSSMPVSSSPTDTTFIAYCTGLPTPGLEYTISVVAISNNKLGALSSVGVHASPSGVDLEPEPSTTTSVSARWMKPDGTVEHYEITCSSGEASPQTITDTTQQSYSAYCVNLTTPGDTYTMTVYSFVDNGTTNSSSLIRLVALPEAVNLTEVSDMVTTTVITASWDNATGVFDYYEVLCSNGTASPARVNRSDGLQASCTGLTPGGDYSISVTTVSSGQRSKTDTLMITAYPNSVVLRAGEITTRQITVLWNDPDGVEDSFIVDCADDGTTDITLNPDDATNGMFQATCNVTMAGAPYNITVTSVSEDKESPATSSFIAATPSAVTIEGTSSNTTSITVSWNASSSADEYEVSCSNGTSVPSSPLLGSATQVTCDGVTPGGNHSVSIVTVENNGRSPAIVTYVVAVPLSADLSANTSTTTSVSAMWPYPGGLVDVFEVVCSNGTESDALVVVDPADLDTSYLVSCDDVYNPGDNYTMSVTSISNKKENSASIVLTALPLSVVLVSSVSTTTSVSATWEFPGGIVDEFEVECSNGTEDFSIADSDEGYRASCEGLENPGDNYTMTVSSLSNLQRNSALIVLTALPGAVNLTEESVDVTTSSITASWSNAIGVFDYYDVSCSNGTASPAQVNPSDELIASCVNLSTPGDDYKLSVTTVSNGLYSETTTITITALPEAVKLAEGPSNTSVISASWTVPSSVVDTFNITCSAGTASPSSIPVDSQAGQELMASCIDLPRSGEEYTLSVVAISKDKQSAVDSIGVYAFDLQEGPSTLTSVSATWIRQKDTVESYSIRCSQGDASPSTIEDTSQQSYSASCVNLTGPGATYTMFVYSEVGTNTSSNSTRASSTIHLVAVPESVESISVVDYTTTTVDVEWQLKECSTCVYNHFILTFEPNSQDPITVDYTNGATQYSSQVSGLTQGKSFNFTVVSVSGVGVEDAKPKTSKEQNVEQRTVPAKPYGLNISPTQRTLSLTWSYPGDADDFTITVMPSHGTAVFNGDLTDPAGEVTGLTPGTEYNVSVVTISGDERSEPHTEGTRTLPHKPSPVQNPVAVPVDKNTITLTYESPTSPNGIIVSYIISYIGTRDNLPDHEFIFVYGPILTVTFDELYPGYSYIFTIIAVNDGGYESDPVSTEPTTTPEEEPPPVPEDYQYQNNTVIPDKSTTGFTVELPSDLFSHENGELMIFSVIITTQANDAAVGSTELTYEEAMSQRENAITPAYVTKNDIPYPYPPSFESSRRRRATEPSATVVIGDGTCSSIPVYCNGALNDGTEYYYAFRAYNSRGSTTSNTFGPVTTERDNLVAIVVGVTVPLVIILVIIVVICMFLRRREQGNLPRSNAKGSDNPDFVPSGYEMVRTIPKPTGSLPNQSHSRPVLLTDFAEYYRQMKADNDFRFTEEYDEIRKVGKAQPIVAALEMVNKDKNRFVNILPYEHSRVKLKALDNEPGSDYINANYVPGYTFPQEFIACQLPLLGTMDDMWRMVWDEKSSIIVMLTKDVQPGKDICLRYWDENNYPVKYGSIVVSLQAVKHYDHWNIREFTLVKAYEIRKLTQYQFTGWPDHGVPDPTQTMLDFVRMVREAIQKEASEHPVIVHCSAGVGRTGVYIALDHLMQVMRENDTVDIFGVVCEMRQYRCEMVQSKRQYVFIHKCILDLLQREDGTGTAHYVNSHPNNEEDTSRIYCTTIPVISHPDM